MTEPSVDELLESLRPRMRRARRRIYARGLIGVSLPIALVAGLMWYFPRGDGSTIVGGPGSSTVSPTVASSTTDSTTATSIDATQPDTTTTVPNTSSTSSAPGTSSTFAIASTTIATGASSTTSATGRTSRPVASAPLCSAHDARAWHGLWDPQRGCHYDHEHKDDPRELDALFGTKIYDIAGGSLGLPWRAPGDPDTTRGTGWLVRRGLPCRNPFGNGCLTDVRVETNAVFSGPGAIAVQRSAWVEARGCADGRCGVARMGGWVDTGPLLVDENIVVGDANSDRGYARHHLSGGTAENYATWFGRSRRFDLALLTNRTWGPVDPKQPDRLIEACAQTPGRSSTGVACRRNGSQWALHILAFDVPASLDEDRDGVVTWSGFTNGLGEIVTNCVRASATCVPLEFIDIPVGSYQYRDDTNGFGDDGRADYDISPGGVNWITYPN